MRPIIVQVTRGKGQEVLKIANQLEGKNISTWSADNNERKLDIVLAFLSNQKVETFIDDVSKIEDAQITLFPQGVMAMYPPQDAAPEQVTNVQSRSPIEIFLAGLQSIGSWKGFIGYSIVASIIVWIGLFTNTVYLLVGAMLIAPFAGPAMNTAIATARGDAQLLKRSMIRYGVAIAITVAATFCLSIIMQQEVATAMMVERSQISSVAVLLALAAGAAGAINLVQSERDSLVSGAAAGMLIAASLAPPTGVIGMAIAIGKWEFVKSGAFLLLLQLIGINLTGSIIFKLYGLNSKGSRYSRGRKKLFGYSLTVTVILLGLLTWWQFSSPVELLRSSTSKRAEAQIQKAVESYNEAGLIDAAARFTRSNIADQNILLCEVYVQPSTDNSKTPETIKQELKLRITSYIKGRLKNVDPVVNIIVL